MVEKSVRANELDWLASLCELRGPLRLQLACVMRPSLRIEILVHVSCEKGLEIRER